MTRPQALSGSEDADAFFSFVFVSVGVGACLLDLSNHEQPIQAKLTKANIDSKLTDLGLNTTCAVIGVPVPVSQGSICTLQPTDIYYVFKPHLQSRA